MRYVAENFRLIKFIVSQRASSYFSRIEEYISSTRLFVYLAPLLLKLLPGYSPLIVIKCLNSIEFIKLKEDVRQYIKSRHRTIRDGKVIRKAIKHSLFLDDLELSRDIFQEAQKKNIKLPQSLMKRVDLSNQNFSAYLESFKFSPKKKLIRKNFPHKYVDLEQIESVMHSKNRIALLTTLGPGDEVCFSYIYSAMLQDEKIDPKSFEIISDHRFTEIFSRTYPEFHFIGSRRTRKPKLADMKKYFNKLDDLRLHNLVCNSSVGAINRSDKVIFNLDLVSFYEKHLLEKKETRTLVPRQESLELFSKFFKKNPTYIGLNWRSSINTSIRSNYYLNIEDLAPLFELENVTFINLQYDDASKELDWVNRKYPGKVQSLNNVDLYNDFESLLAIFNYLELVVSAPTIISEFSAQSGCKTLLIANTREIAARNVSGGRDLWSKNIKVVTGDELGDKSSLVEALKDNIKSHLATLN